MFSVSVFANGLSVKGEILLDLVDAQEEIDFQIAAKSLSSHLLLARLPSPVFDNRARGGDYLYAAHGGLEHSLFAPDRRKTLVT